MDIVVDVVAVLVVGGDGSHDFGDEVVVDVVVMGSHWNPYQYWKYTTYCSHK